MSNVKAHRMPTNPATRISPWLFWGVVPLSIIPLLYSLPSTYRQIQDSRILAEFGRQTIGIVTEHERIQGGGRGCKSRVTVLYQVSGQPYTLTSLVCSTSPDELPRGRAIDVRYVPSSPAMATLHSARVRSSDVGWGSVAIQLALPFAFGWLGWLAWRKQQNAP